MVGCDFFKPYYIVHGRKNLKHRVCIFTCFTTRAVFSEICENMSSNSFLNAFFRFFNTTSHATKEVWSDNGTNLVGEGGKELKRSLESINWG